MVPVKNILGVSFLRKFKPRDLTYYKNGTSRRWIFGMLEALSDHYRSFGIVRPACLDHYRSFGIVRPGCLDHYRSFGIVRPGCLDQLQSLDNLWSTNVVLDLEQRIRGAECERVQ